MNEVTPERMRLIAHNMFQNASVGRAGPDKVRIQIQLPPYSIIETIYFRQLGESADHQLAYWLKRHDPFCRFNNTTM